MALCSFCIHPLEKGLSLYFSIYAHLSASAANAGANFQYTLHFSDHFLPVPRVILSACSPYFRAMFTGELAESRATEVTIRDVDEQAMEQLVEFCYTAHIVVEESNVQVSAAWTGCDIQRSRGSGGLLPYRHRFSLLDYCPIGPGSVW